MKVLLTCPVCRRQYEADAGRLKFGRQTTCSRACSYEYRSAAKRQQITLLCAACGKQFNRPTSQVKGKYGSQFCSRHCHYLGRSLGLSGRVVSRPYRMDNSEAARQGRRIRSITTWRTRRKNGSDRHSQETIEKLRLATSKAIADGRIAAVSKLEDEVAEALDRIGIEHMRDRPILLCERFF